jgi:translation initiation factor IF-2
MLPAAKRGQHVPPSAPLARLAPHPTSASPFPSTFRAPCRQPRRAGAGGCVRGPRGVGPPARPRLWLALGPGGPDAGGPRPLPRGRGAGARCAAARDRGPAASRWPHAAAVRGRQLRGGEGGAAATEGAGQGTARGRGGWSGLPGGGGGGARACGMTRGVGGRAEPGQPCCGAGATQGAPVSKPRAATQPPRSPLRARPLGAAPPAPVKLLPAAVAAAAAALPQGVRGSCAGGGGEPSRL